MSEEREPKVAHKLFALWVNRETEWLKYKDIIGELERLGVSERTIARYLSKLTRERKLLKEERGYKKTFYRPSRDSLKALLSSLDQIRVHEESLSRIGKYVMDTMVESVVETEETTKRIQNRVEREIEKSLKNGEDSEEYEKVIIRVLAKETLTKEESKIFASLLDQLTESIDSLSNYHVFGRITDSEELASILDDNIWSIVSAYMHVWIFMYKHPRAFLNLKRLRQSRLSL